jgi:NCS1 family nucleobase:cation symporter-1
MIFNRKLIRFSAISVYLGIIIFFFSILLSDVKISSKAFVSLLDYNNFVDKSNIAPLITVIGTTFTFFSIIIISYGDFSRYVKDENQLKKGNFSLLLNLIIFSFFTLFIVTGADAFLKQDPENLNRILTNPNDIIGKLDDLLIIILALIFIIIASASTNLIANFIPSQYSLINLKPSLFSFKSSSLIILISGFLVSIFWLTYFSQIGALSYIDTISAFFGPLVGLIIADFYLVKKENLINKDIYSVENSGAYYYSGGWHIKGIYALFLGFIFSASTIWNTNLMFLQSYSWIIGAFVSFLIYYLLAKE